MHEHVPQRSTPSSCLSHEAGKQSGKEHTNQCFQEDEECGTRNPKEGEGSLLRDQAGFPSRNHQVHSLASPTKRPSAKCNKFNLNAKVPIKLKPPVLNEAINQQAHTLGPPCSVSLCQCGWATIFPSACSSQHGEGHFLKEQAASSSKKCLPLPFCMLKSRQQRCGAALFHAGMSVQRGRGEALSRTAARLCELWERRDGMGCPLPQCMCLWGTEVTSAGLGQCGNTTLKPIPSLDVQGKFHKYFYASPPFNKES